jgi:hypothetical protein
MKPRLEDVLTDDERLDLWVEMMALATAMQEYCDWWWRLDAGMRLANDSRVDNVDSQPGPPAPTLSD